MRTILQIFAYLIAAIFLWEICITIFAPPAFLLPAPESVFSSVWENQRYYGKHFSTTALEAIGGFLLGTLLGITLGIFLRYSRWFERLFSPIVIASQVFPKEALAPIFIIALGYGVESKIAISALICFFPVAINVHRGLNSSPDLHLMLLSSLAARPWQRFFYCDLPFAAPFIFSGLRMAATLSVIGAVVGEFVGAGAGLGYVIRAASAEIAVERVYAALILLGVLGSIMYGFITFADRYLFSRLSKSLRTL